MLRPVSAVLGGAELTGCFFVSSLYAGITSLSAERADIAHGAHRASCALRHLNVRLLVDRGLTDLKSRDGKAPGGFCSGFLRRRSRRTAGGIVIVWSGWRGGRAPFLPERARFQRGLQLGQSRVGDLLL